MNVNRLFDSLSEEIKRLVPADMKITSINFEGPLIAVYTDDYEKYS